MANNLTVKRVFTIDGNGIEHLYELMYETEEERFGNCPLQEMPVLTEADLYPYCWWDLPDLVQECLDALNEGMDVEDMEADMPSILCDMEMDTLYAIQDECDVIIRCLEWEGRER